MPKTVPESKFVELAGLDRISVKVHEMKCLWREINKDDVGIDGEIEVLTPKDDGKGYQVTGGIIKAQAKSGSSYIKESRINSFSVKSTLDDFKGWYNSTFPVLFIIYHPEDDKLYWKEMRSYLRNTKNVWQSPIKIIFNKSTDEFNTNSRQDLQTISETSPSRISHQEKEKLYSNIFKITRKPNKIWNAPCIASTREEVFEDFVGSAPPFIVVAKTLYTFSNLYKNECFLRNYCDTSKISLDYADNFCIDEDRTRNYVNLLNILFAKQLFRKGIKYNRKFKRDYFPREDDESLEFKKEWYNIRTGRTSSRTTAKYYEYGFYKFWRHHAASINFKKLNNNWYLQIVPKYFFTLDGTQPCDPDMVGPYTTRIKAAEANINVLNHVLFWINAISKLGSKSKKIEIWLDEQDRKKSEPLMIIEKMPMTGITEFAIPYDPATYDETEKPHIQTNLIDLLNIIDEDGSDGLIEEKDEY